MITDSAGTLHSGSGLKASIFREGAAFCTEQGKVFQPISSNSRDGVYGANRATAEVQFRCLDKDDSEVHRPTLKPVANVRVENIYPEKTEVQSPQSGDMYVELKKLKKLLDSGVITQSEFDKQKAKILNK